MDKTITLEFPEKKQEALSHFLKKKDTTIEAELDYALARLYEKIVPPTVREFLEDTGSDGDSPQNFKNHLQGCATLWTGKIEN